MERGIVPTVQEIADFFKQWKASMPTILVNPVDYNKMRWALDERHMAHLVKLEHSTLVKEGTMLWLDLSTANLLDSLHDDNGESEGVPAKGGGQPRYVRSTKSPGGWTENPHWQG